MVIEKLKGQQKGLILVISLVLMLAGIGIAGLVLIFIPTNQNRLYRVRLQLLPLMQKNRSISRTKQTSEILSLIQQSLIRPRQTNGLIRIDLTENNNGEQK